MKKLFLILVMTAMVTTAWSQSKLSTIRGKTKDGKTIKVEYYQGSVEDYIESVKYQVVDELQSEVKDLKGKTKTLQNKVDDAEKQVKSLKAKIAAYEENPPKSNGGDDKEMARLRKEVADKETEISNMNKQIKDLQADITNLQTNINDQKRQLEARKTTIDSLKQVVKKGGKQPVGVVSGPTDDDLQRLRDSVVSKDATISKLKGSVADYKQRVADLEKAIKDMPKPGPDGTVVAKPAKTPGIGVSAGFGPTFIMNKGMDDIWAKKAPIGMTFAVYYETGRFTDALPISAQAGIGIGNYKMSGKVSSYDYTMHGFEDADGDTCTAHYSFTDIAETLSLTYLNIPISLCIGQPAKDRVSAYFKVGLTPSIKIGSSFAGEGKYSLCADYYQWGLHLDDVNHLGYGTGFDCYTDVQPEVNSFVLWGNMAFGVYVPFNGAPIVVNAGVKCDMMLMSVGKSEALDKTMSFNANTCNLLIGSPKLFCPSVELGVIYTLK